MKPLHKNVLTALFIAIGVLSAHLISIPIGPSRCFPVQSAVNILLAAWLGTRYAVSGAFLTSLLRNILGTGSLLAFPGSLFGALLAGFLYRKTQNILWASLGEIIGTGILGSVIGMPIATYFLGSKALGLFFLVPPFTLSAIGGAVIAWLLYKSPITKSIKNNSY